MNRTPKHHPTESTLLRFAAGRLPASHALVVAAHLEGCPACRAGVRAAEIVGGALLAEMPAAVMAEDALTRALARLDEPASKPAPPPPARDLAPGVPLPAALRDLAVPRWRWMAPGIHRIALDIPGAAPGERAYLLRVAPGTELPEHGHEGEEITCILSGSFSDTTGTYGPGDVAEMDEEGDHRPVADAGVPCICLIATQGRLRMRGLLARLIQPLVGV
ncbi:MAG: cupin domain-containing protein [Alphaproteobacteria bacterium]|nr:cupin domain-containing protein [Alphaproteobacteria bacterium]